MREEWWKRRPRRGAISCSGPSLIYEDGQLAHLIRSEKCRLKITECKAAAGCRTANTPFDLIAVCQFKYEY